MTIAEIHGKLKPYERMEDLLTSDVFSTFKYLDVNKGLIPFLSRAIKVIDMTNPDFLLDIVEADYVFWPKTTKLNREPDVLIILTKEGGSTLSILIEAKYTSGKSNINREKDKADNILDHLDGDQLAELYKELQEGNIYIKSPLLRKKFVNSLGNRYLFYVSSHYVLPIRDFVESFKILNKKQYSNPTDREFYWVNWICIIDVINEVLSKENHNPPSTWLLTDLRDLLYKKGLVPFCGFSNLQLDYQVHKIFFWEEDIQSYEQSLFSRIDIKKLNREPQNFFWKGE